MVNWSLPSHQSNAEANFSELSWEKKEGVVYGFKLDCLESVDLACDDLFYPKEWDDFEEIIARGLSEKTQFFDSSVFVEAYEQTNVRELSKKIDKLEQKTEILIAQLGVSRFSTSIALREIRSLIVKENQPERTDLYEKGLLLEQLNCLFKTIYEIKEQNVVEQASFVLSLLYSTSQKYNLTNFPPIWASYSEEEQSLSIEWVMKNQRLGFNIENNSSESGWFYVTSPELGSIQQVGKLQNIPTEEIWAKLISGR